MNIFSYALLLAKNNWCVFPCKEKDKTPITANGYKAASKDINTLQTWLKKTPNANIGIATGKKSGFFVLDIDICHEKGKYGDISLAQLESEHGKLPDTVQVITGSGGIHYYFKTPDDCLTIPCSTGKVGQGIDIRGDGGYVIAPESIHPNGNKYEWEASSDPFEEGVIIANAPVWLLEMVVSNNIPITLNKKTGEYYQSSEWDSMGESARKDFLDALYICPNVSREEWLYAGMAIHSMDSTETGFELWQQWSKTCEKYDPPDQARVWASFNNKKTEKKTKDYIFGLRKKIL
jgi:hypothetical protein